MHRTYAQNSIRVKEGSVMRFEQLDLNLLVALDVLLEEQNISRTAEKLFLSQSATSSVLARLRDYFKDDLFVQVGRKMEPTPYALELQMPIKQMLSIARSSITSKRTMDLKERARHFRIVASDYIVQVFLSKMLQEVSTKAPNFTFEFLTPFSMEGEALARQHVDIIVVPEQNLIESYSHAILSKDELVCIADQNSNVVKNGLTIKNFSECGHATIGSGRTSLLSIEKWLHQTKHIKRKIEVITSDFTSMCSAIVGTERLAVMPKLLVNKLEKHYPIQALPLPFESPDFVEHLMWHPTLDSDPVHKWLREQILALSNDVES